MFDIWTDALARISVWLGLRPGEGRRTALASVYHLGFVAGVVLLKSASNALVVSRFQAQSLPPLYIGSALATGLVAWLAAHLAKGQARKIPRKGLIVAAMALGALTIAVEHELPLAVIALYLFGEAVATLISIRFWGGASELFDPRQSRRIFGILGGAGMGGAILAGLLAQLLGERLGAVGLLPLAMAIFLASASAGQALFLRTRFGPREPRPREALPPSHPGKEARAYFLGSRHAQGMAVLMLLLASLTAVADFVFRSRAGQVLDEGQMASLFGALNFWMGLLAVIFQLGAAGKILERWGVFRYLSLTPSLTGAVSVACLSLPGVGPAFALRLVESAGSLSLNPAAFQLLYGPVPDRVRNQIRSFIDGMVKKVGFAGGGALLMLVGPAAGETVLLWLMVGIVVAIALVLRRAKTHYLETIESRLARSVGRSSHLVHSAEIRAVLRKGLDSDEPVRLLTSLALLKRDPRFDPAPALPRLLRHEDLRVRLAAIQMALERRVTQVAGKLERLLREDVEEVRYEAILALGKLAPARARECLEPLLGEGGPLAGAAIAALLPWEAGEGPATAALQARLRQRAPSVEVRRETVRALGKLGRSPFSQEIATYLLDVDPSVRRDACVAAGESQDERLLETLAGLLTDRAVRTQARKALASFGDAAVPLLTGLLDDRALSLSLRLEIPRVLRFIGTEAASHAMLHSNIQDHAYLRYRIATNLSKLHDEHPEVGVASKRLREATLRRLQDYEYHLHVYRDLEGALPPGAPLLRALDGRLQQNLELIFRLLQIRFRDVPLIGAWRAFSQGGARDRAYCLELLEHLLDPGLRELIVPTLEQYHRLPASQGGIAPDPRRAPARVMELAVSDDQELAAIATHTARKMWENPPLPPTNQEANALEAVVIERMFLFEGVETFSECDVDDLVALAQIVQERFCRKGEVIYREGDEGGALFVVVQGEVACTRGGREVLRVGVRDTFGQSSLLDGGRRPVTAVAATDEVRLLAIQRDDFLALISDRPDLLRGIFNAVTRHLRQVLEGVGAMTEEARETLERERSVG